ncbi:MAG: pilus assembly protein PilM [Planctomycetes bacterium]|nr:pilus assembly protein PilM [Planctomycetota bacterium]
MASIVWGIDIGTSAVKVAKARRGSGGVEILDFDILEIPFDENEETRPERVKQTLMNAVARKAIASAPVYVSIPGGQTFFRPFTLPTVEERRVPEIVQYEARQQIPFPFEEILWGYQHQMTPEGEMQVRLVAVRRDDVAAMLEMMKSIGLNVEGLVAAPVALFNFAAYEYTTDVTTLVLDCGAKMTDFLVMEGGAFWFRPLTVGVEEMTRTLKQKFRISQEEAENILFKMDRSKQAEKMFQVIEPVIRNLAGDIQRSLGYYKSLSHNVRVEKVVGLGGAFRMPQIREYVGRMLGQDVDIPTSAVRFTAAPGLDAGWLNEEVGSMAVALGLTVQGLGLARANINLLPENVVHDKMMKRKRPWAVVGALALLAAVMFSYFVQGKVLAGYKEDVHRADSIITERNGLTAKHDAVIKEIAPLEGRLEFYSRIGRDRGWYVDCLDKLNKTLLKIDPRTNPLSEKQPDIYVKQVYMSRFPADVCMRPLEKDPAELIEKDERGRTPAGPVFPGTATVPTFGQPGAKGGETGAGAVDSPMEVVMLAEIRGEKEAEEAPIDPAIRLRDELLKVECFQGVDVEGGWKDYRKIDMKYKDYLLEEEKRKKGEPHKIVTRPYRMFKMRWRYDDGTDRRPKEDKKP